ncbi:hypothetical protein KX928_23405 [Roseobacter sp. YSTF-M11]|uniref:Uncharacterized protein n=1 Tax=Roseobacter insulae TaxID=2859783 RepID=A0A9X1G021_9RHOB|nr:hypothetical protein [Roseobacter insulae]MBW4710748.1 hypothetical protein [Roseobacter insulae]
MTRYALIGALLAVIGLGAVVYFQRATVDGLRTEKARLEGNVQTLADSAAQAREAQAVAEAYRQGAEQASAVLSRQVETILTTDYGGCADAEIDPALLLDLSGR